VKIALNGQKLVTQEPAGPEVYALNTIRSLASIDSVNTYTVYFDRPPAESFWQELSAGNPNFSYRVLPGGLSWTHVSLARELFRDKPDLYFGTNHTLPLLKPGKTVYISMIHGLEYRVNQQLRKWSFKYAIHPLIIWWVLKTSSLVIVPSLSVSEALKILPWPFLKSLQIRTIPEGTHPRFFKRRQEEVEQIRKKYGLGDFRYLIFVSTLQPRKNIPGMVQGFSLAVKDRPDLRETRLVICGKHGWKNEMSLKAPETYGVAQQVLFLGRIPDEDLPSLYTGADHFINLSLEEGFGLPLLEAMACETPTLVSDIPAFRELGRDLPIYVEPTNPLSIKEGIIKALTSDRDEKKIKAAKELANRYTWQETASQLLSIFNSLIEHV